MSEKPMTAKPWGEKEMLQLYAVETSPAGAFNIKLAGVEKAALRKVIRLTRRAAFEEAMAAEAPVPDPAFNPAYVNGWEEGERAKNAAIRAKMEGEK